MTLFNDQLGLAEIILTQLTCTLQYSQDIRGLWCEDLSELWSVGKYADL